MTKKQVYAVVGAFALGAVLSFASSWVQRQVARIDRVEAFISYVASGQR